MPNALYVHRSSLDELDPLLRVYEGCARAFLGEIAVANILKLHRFSGKISYLAYPDFDADPHPVLATCVKLNMRSRQIDFYDYRQSANPPVLHRKESFLAPTHLLFPEFARVTRQEGQPWAVVCHAFSVSCQNASCGFQFFSIRRCFSLVQPGDTAVCRRIGPGDA